MEKSKHTQTKDGIRFPLRDRHKAFFCQCWADFLTYEEKGFVLISGYAHPIYKKLSDAGFVREDFSTSCSAAGRTRATGILGKGEALKKQPRTETVWMNYQLQLNLF